MISTLGRLSHLVTAGVRRVGCVIAPDTMDRRPVGDIRRGNVTNDSNVFSALRASLQRL